MFKTAQEVLLANTMISVQDYTACWAEGGGVVLRVDGEKPFAPLSQAVGQEGWIFYTVTTVLPFPGEIRDKHEEGGAERGTGKPALGRRRGKEKKGVGHTA